MRGLASSLLMVWLTHLVILWLDERDRVGPDFPRSPAVMRQGPFDAVEPTTQMPTGSAAIARRLSE